MADPLAPPDDFAARQRRFFNLLGVILVVGVAFAFIYGLGYLPGAGVLNLEQAARTALLAIVVVTIILTLFLTRVGVIFDIDKKVDKMFKLEADRLAEARKRELDEAREFRDGLRRDLAGMRDDIRKEFNAWDSRIQDAVRAANQAMKMAQDAMNRALALEKEPAYRSAIEQMQKDIASLLGDVKALRTADKVNSPLLQELKERVAALESGHKKLNVRVDETMDSIERRDMEHAALRQTLDNEVANLRKRESLLLVKQKEMEDFAMDMQSKAEKQAVVLKPGEEKQHIMEIEGIGKVYASRLNAQGVITIPQLLAVNAENIAQTIDATPELVAEWQAMAKLIRLKGIGPQSAEVLVKAGIRSVQQLAAEDATALSNKIRELERSRKVRIQGLDITPVVAKRWIETARKGEYDNGV
ncbi:MAG: DUF4332 domain-containing protein [bacterium]